MKPLVLSIGASILVLGVAWAQTTGANGNEPQLPVGQVFKNFEFPLYDEGKLRYTLNAAEAKGITLNRAEAKDLKIELYENGLVTTTITSPDADLYVSDRKMRTKNTVQIDRNDMTATAQSCDFDLINKKYLLRTNVKVVLKHFDASLASPAPTASSHAAPSETPATAPVPAAAPRPLNDASLLDSPGAYANTNSAPIPSTSPDTK